MGMDNGPLQSASNQILSATDALRMHSAVANQYERFGDNLNSLNIAYSWTVTSCPGYYYHAAAEAMQQQVRHVKAIQPLYEHLTAAHCSRKLTPHHVDSEYVGQPPMVVLKDTEGEEVCCSPEAALWNTRSTPREGLQIAWCIRLSGIILPAKMTGNSEKQEFGNKY